MGKASGSTRIVNPSTESRQETVAGFNAAMASGKYDRELSYLPDHGSGSMLYQFGHNYHIEEIEAGRALADNGYRVVLTPEGIVAYATAFKRDGTPKYAEGTISEMVYDQRTTASNVQNVVNNVDNAIVHAREKGASIALLYDRYGKMHRGDIEAGMQKYKAFAKQDDIKAVLVVSKDGKVYEHHFD